MLNYPGLLPGSSIGRAVGCKLNCSFHERSWSKNRVNSGKPALRGAERVILSQAPPVGGEGAETRAKARTRAYPPGEAPDTLAPSEDG